MNTPAISHNLLSGSASTQAFGSRLPSPAARTVASTAARAEAEGVPQRGRGLIDADAVSLTTVAELVAGAAP